MNILILGSGGREHALAWKLASSPLCERLFIAPGNPGTAQCGTNLAVEVADHAAVMAAARAQRELEGAGELRLGIGLDLGWIGDAHLDSKDSV